MFLGIAIFMCMFQGMKTTTVLCARWILVKITIMYTFQFKQNTEMQLKEILLVYKVNTLYTKKFHAIPKILKVKLPSGDI